ncbi:MAG TPA: LuxR C-terminal-related transcriptional regulator [Opitutaceae bacterium]|nr:LuxR C-terminal-related transcriptional regulator [Opitutaceae bacterium]
MTASTTLHDAGAALPSGRGQRAVLALHRAMDFADLWTALQRLFETLVPHDTLVMSVNYLDWRSELTTRRLTSAKSRIVDPEEKARLVAVEGRAFFGPFLEDHPGIPCYRHTDVMRNEKKIPATPYYQRYMLPLGWRYSAHLLFWRGEQVETSFALRRRPDQGDFTPGEMALLRTLHQHIGVAFERVRIFEGERRRRRLLENFYRAKPEAVVFLDWSLDPVYASQEALALCAAWNFGPEKARTFTPQAVFKIPAEIVAACASLKPAWEKQASAAPTREPAPLSAGVSSGLYRAAITLRRESAGALTKPIFVIHLHSPEAALLAAGGGESSPERLRAQLTPTERALADLVCAGLSNKEIAARLGRSEGSVKVQLSGIFQKLGVTSRSRLMVALR